MVLLKADDKAEVPGGGGGEAIVCDEGEEAPPVTTKYSRSWKKIYIQRQIAENAWQTGQVKRVTTLVGHTAWISCLHFDENRIVRHIPSYARLRSALLLYCLLFFTYTRCIFKNVGQWCGRQDD